MVPWSNRIGGGGFEQNGRFYPMQPNRAGEPYPIHGDGWIQPWLIEQTAEDTMLMTLESREFAGNPHHYKATQTFRLVDSGLDHTVSVEHLGDEPLFYGLGVHPWFERTPLTRITANVRGVWLSGADPLPTRHTHDFPTSWDLNAGASAHGDLIDNAFSGWDGRARIDWPERALQLTLTTPDFERDGGLESHWCLVYRPPHGVAFCFEPITQPINAFNLPGKPGLRSLAKADDLSLKMRWRFATLGNV
jgi:aldose 1-epimerase